jgi:hypothetical protein
VQIVLASIALSLLVFGLYSFADRTAAQAVVLLILSIAAAGAAYLLSDGPSVRVPTPARLDELAGRAERVAIEKAAD